MKNTTGIIIGVIVLIAAIWAITYYSGRNETPAGTSGEETGSGNLYISITDQTLAIENVNEIDMRVNKIEVYSKEEGWITIGSDPKTFALLALKANGQAKLYGKTEVNTGLYERIRVTLGETNVRTKAGATVKAVLPSAQVVINSNIRVNADANAHVTLDVLADKSLHLAAGGKYVFAPVIYTQARSNANVTINTDETVAVSGGRVDADTRIGVDLEGASRPNFELITDGGARLEIKSVLGNVVSFSLDGQSYVTNISKVQENVTTETQTETDASSSLNLNGVLDVNSSANTNTNSNLNLDLNSVY